jgi:tetratricopeptide (TPR) repeat protein
MMRSTCRRVFLGFLFVLLTAGVVDHAAAKDNWVRLKSTNFVLVGNADQKKIRDIAIRLEQYRDVFTRLLPGIKYTSKVPTTIMVFKDMKSYSKFRPGNVAGYFQPGVDGNYLSLSADLDNGQSPFEVMFHEYTHLLIHNSNFSDVPTWFNEGLAEYYSTFQISDDRQVRIGTVIPSHLYVLRQSKALPLATLFSVDHDSPYYNEDKKQTIFYAQSWLLVHYFIQNNDGARLPQLARFLELLLNRVVPEEAFQQAFNATFADIEKELKAYLALDSHRISVATFEEKLETSRDVAFEPLDEATALAYQGDLLVHSRLQGGDVYLNKALALDPNQGRALLALGQLYRMTGKRDEAFPLFERAVAADAGNVYAQYFYADAVLAKSQRSLAPEQVAKLRASMKAAIQTDPTFTELYRVLLYLSLVDRQELDEAVALTERALTAAPTQHELRLSLAQAYAGRGELARARAALQIVARVGQPAQLRQRAQTMLNGIPDGDDFTPRSRGSSPPRLDRRDNPTGPSSPIQPSFRPVREGETRVRGVLTDVECPAGDSVILIVKVGDKTYRIRNAHLGAIKFVSFTSTVSPSRDVGCGPMSVQNTVLATFVSDTGMPNIDGEAIALEFIDADVVLP